MRPSWTKKNNDPLAPGPRRRPSTVASSVMTAPGSVVKLTAWTSFDVRTRASTRVELGVVSAPSGSSLESTLERVPEAAVTLTTKSQGCCEMAVSHVHHTRHFPPSEYVVKTPT